MTSISIITTLYKSEKYIDEFYRRIIKVSEENFNDIEIIFVNDASPDGSLDKSVALSKMDNRVTVIDLAINATHHKAIMTGLTYTTKDYIWLIDIDLEEKPEWLKTFYLELIKSNVDVVYGKQIKRKGNLFEKISGAIFFKFMESNSKVNFQDSATTARIMTRRYVNNLCRFRESSPILAGLWAITGFQQKPLLVKKLSLNKTTYTNTHKLKLALEAILSFSTTPITIMAFIGFISMIISFIVIVFLVLSYASNNSILNGWTSIMASIWFFGGFLAASISLIGLYVAKIYAEVKSRPYTIIKDIYSNNKNKIFK